MDRDRRTTPATTSEVSWVTLTMEQYLTFVPTPLLSFKISSLSSPAGLSLGTQLHAPRAATLLPGHTRAGGRGGPTCLVPRLPRALSLLDPAGCSWQCPSQGSSRCTPSPVGHRDAPVSACRLAPDGRGTHLPSRPPLLTCHPDLPHRCPSTRPGGQGPGLLPQRPQSLKRAPGPQGRPTDTSSWRG